MPSLSHDLCPHLRYVFFIFDTTYIKYVCDTVRMTNWGRVYYTNLLTLPFLVLLIVIGREVPLLLSTQWNIQVSFFSCLPIPCVRIGPYFTVCTLSCSQVLLPLVLSCIIGVCMSHSAYLLRSNCRCASPELAADACVRHPYFVMKNKNNSLVTFFMACIHYTTLWHWSVHMQWDDFHCGGHRLQVPISLHELDDLGQARQQRRLSMSTFVHSCSNILPASTHARAYNELESCGSGDTFAGCPKHKCTKRGLKQQSHPAIASL